MRVYIGDKMGTHCCKLKNCKKYKTCKLKKDPFQKKSLCWGYEKYINQDVIKNINQFEVLFSEINLNLDRIDIPLIDYYTNINKKIEIIKLFFFCKMSVDEISQQLHCSKQYIYSQIKICKTIILNHINKQQVE